MDERKQIIAIFAASILKTNFGVSMKRKKLFSVVVLVNCFSTFNSPFRDI